MVTITHTQPHDITAIGTSSPSLQKIQNYEIFLLFIVRYVLFYSSVKFKADLSYFKRVINFFVSTIYSVFLIF